MDRVNVREHISFENLRDVDIFAGLSDTDLERVAKVCSLRTYQAGEHCGLQGETIDELRIVNGGKVAIEMRIDATPFTQTLNIANLTRGKVFAWSALVEPHVLTASSRCVERSQIICIKAPDLQGIFQETPLIENVVMKNLATVISSRLRDSWTQLTRLISELIKEGR